VSNKTRIREKSRGWASGRICASASKKGAEFSVGQNLFTPYHFELSEGLSES
jgi:hypothetical protein